MPELGILGAGNPISVTPFGGIHWLDRKMKVSWAIGADDRWHFAEQETTIRQNLSAKKISPETRVRVPGGDIEQCVDVIPVGSGSATMVEFENTTPVPVALALILMNFDELTVEGPLVKSGSSQVMLASKPVALTCSAKTLVDLQKALEETAAKPSNAGEIINDKGHTAVIFPLPHGTKLRLLLNNDEVDELPNPKGCPEFSEIAKGWERHLDMGMQVILPDNRILEAAIASRRHLLIGSGQPLKSEFWSRESSSNVAPICANALIRWGHRHAGRKILLEQAGATDPLLFGTRIPTSILLNIWAWQSYFSYEPEDKTANILAPWIKEVTLSLLESIPGKRRRKGKNYALELSTLESAAMILRCAGETELSEEIDFQARSLRESMGNMSYMDPLLDAITRDKMTFEGYQKAFASHHQYSARGIGVGELLAQVDSTGSFPKGTRTQDPLSSSLYLLALREALVTQRIDLETDNGIALLEAFDKNWIGAQIEVERAPIKGGEIGFAIRWHGAAPALLWEAQTEKAFTMALPALDGDWSTSELKGEALLSEQLLPETAVSIVEAGKIVLGNKPDHGNESGTFS